MRSIPEQRIAEFQEQDYQLYFGISKLEFDRMLQALYEAYRQEHKRKTRFTKISMMDKLKAEAAKWATQEEDVLTYAMFPQVAPKFFDKRNAKKQGVDGDHVDYTNQSHPV